MSRRYNRPWWEFEGVAEDCAIAEAEAIDLENEIARMETEDR